MKTLRERLGRAAVVAASAVAVTLSASGPASAKPPAGARKAQGPAKAAAAKKAEARKLLNEARAATNEGRHADAARALRKADELDPSLQTKLDLSRALAAAGKLVEASRVLHAVADAPVKPWEKRFVAAAKRLLADLEPRIPWVQVTIVGPRPYDASTTIDGEEVDPAGEIPLDPGEHVVAAEAEGYEPAERRITLVEGAHERVRLSLKKVVVAEAEPPRSGEGSVVPAAVSLAFGAAAVGVGSVFGIMAFGEEGKAEDARDSFRESGCASARTSKKCAALQADFDAALETSKANGTASTVAFLAGGIGLATGIVLLLVRPGGSSSEDRRDETARVTPWIGPGQAGLAGRF